jgi:Asp-tRNA(Asn)/Glu-tRNA(Gln) amidotransferase B subunit
VDEFPEAFKRFEKRVDVDRINSFRQLTLAFSYWAGWRWKGTKRQIGALKVEAWKRGIPVPVELRPQRPHKVRTWRHETVKVRGKLQSRYRYLKTGRFIKKAF